MEIEITPGRDRNVQNVLRKFLYGGQEANEAAVRSVMKKITEERARRFKERVAFRHAVEKHFATLQAPLLELFKENEKAAHALRGLGEISEKLSKQKPVYPETPKERPRFFTGSIGSIVVPPCLWPFTDRDNESGSPAVNVHASNNGTMGFALSNQGNESSADVIVGLTFYLYPPANGHLIVQSNPSYSGFWNYSCWLHHAGTEGAIGMDVHELDLNNNFIRVVRSDPHQLWNEDHGWGADFGKPSGPGLPLYAELGVDTGHHYMIFVWCQGTIEAFGGGVFGNSSASSYLDVTVPSVRWELY